MLNDPLWDFDIWIKKNTGIFTGVFVLYVSALCAGVFFVRGFVASDANLFAGFYENLTINVNDGDIGFWLLFIETLKINIRYLFFMFIAGFIVVGVPFVLAIFSMKIFCLGFALGTIYSLSYDGGFILSVLTIFLQNMFSLPLLTFYAVICTKFSFRLYKNVRGIPEIKNDFAKALRTHITVFVIFALLITAASFFECLSVLAFSSG
ncbi:MAG: stage II sporulation protein M [Clostridia bacterium]|nr:stage II sporulation protein M [Clostridia bacterium]